jgi:uncharacterized membrane protein
MPKSIDLSALVLASLSVLSPPLVVLLLRQFGAISAFCFVIALLAGRLALPWLRGVPLSLSLAVVPVMIAMVSVGVFDQEFSVRLYPVFVNAAMLIVFAASLLRPPTIIERFARGLEPDLPPEGVRYTRRVTQVWMAFFCLNGAIAMWTVMVPGWKFWLIYNGLIAYLAMGILFGGEYLVRRWIRKRIAV